MLKNTLHSTMFLLILGHPVLRFVQNNFTFHYVSINTLWRWNIRIALFNFTFHYVSINTIQQPTSWRTSTNFTFHYVSINTKVENVGYLDLEPLHSTMFLLILLAGNVEIEGIEVFTFHYVSINTSSPKLYFMCSIIFTFHYVSINTRSSEPPINSSILYHILSTMIFFYLFIYFDITRFTGSTILLMFFTFVDLS